MSEPMAAKMVSKRFYGWTNVFLLFFTYMGPTGLVFYALSVIFPFMIKEMNWNRGDASIAISISTLAMGLLVPIGVKMLNKFGARKVIISGLAITAINLLLLSTMVTKLWHWIAVWGVLIPLGRALCHQIAIQTNIMHWFTRKRAMAIGIVMTGAPLGGFLAPPIYTWFIKLMGGWRFGWMLSLTVVIMALGMAFFIKNKPSDIGQYPDGVSPEDEDTLQDQDQGTRQKIYRSKTEWTLKEVLKTKTIWFITAANIAQMLTLTLIINHGVLHLTDLDYLAMQAATILSVIIISSGVVRFPLGWVGDRMEPRWIFFSSLLLMFIGFLGLWRASSYGALMIYGPIYGIGYGSVITILPTLMGNYYGPEVFPNINGFFIPFLVLLNAIVPTAAGYVVETFGSYDWIFIILAVLMACGVIFSAFSSPPERKVAVQAA